MWLITHFLKHQILEKREDKDRRRLSFTFSARQQMKVTGWFLINIFGALSSVGSEYLPYKQGVGSSNLPAPTPSVAGPARLNGKVGQARLNGKVGQARLNGKVGQAREVRTSIK